MSFSILGLAPFLAVWVVAAVIAGIRWQRHPVVSALVVTSSAIHALVMVAQGVMPMRLIQSGYSAASLVPYQLAVGLVGVVGSVCMVAAAFIGRQDSGASSVSRPL